MADFIFNQALGRIREFADDAAGDVAAAEIVCLLITAADADATQRDFDEIQALLAGTSNEANFTNYVRKDIADGSITVTVDDTNNRVDIDIPDQTWTSAGNGTNNTMTDAVFAYDNSGSGADNTLIPISQHDFTPTTDGSDLTLQVDSAGLLRAS
jgi:hypothetical protein